ALRRCRDADVPAVLHLRRRHGGGDLHQLRLRRDLQLRLPRPVGPAPRRRRVRRQRRGHLRVDRPGAADDRRGVGRRHHRRPRRADPHRRRGHRPLPAGGDDGLVPRRRPRTGGVPPADARDRADGPGVASLRPVRLPRQCPGGAGVRPQPGARRGDELRDPLVGRLLGVLAARPVGAADDGGRAGALLQRHGAAAGDLPRAVAHDRAGAAVGVVPPDPGRHLAGQARGARPPGSPGPAGRVDRGAARPRAARAALGDPQGGGAGWL
ncbi:MAG: Efflux ABC transporter, permease protein, partial [uncultured Nocardioides sp.]